MKKVLFSLMEIHSVYLKELKNTNIIKNTEHSAALKDKVSCFLSQTTCAMESSTSTYRTCTPHWWWDMSTWWSPPLLSLFTEALKENPGNLSSKHNFNSLYLFSSDVFNVCLSVCLLFWLAFVRFWLVTFLSSPLFIFMWPISSIFQKLRLLWNSVQCK